MMRILRRYKHRRHDKLRLWVGMIVTAAVPIVIFWVLPNALADHRERAEMARVVAAEEADQTFRSSYADLFTICEESGTLDDSVQVPVNPRVLVVQHGKLADVQDRLPDAWQPDGPDDVSVVVCLGREATQPGSTCSSGETPDLTAFVGYELLALDFYATHATSDTQFPEGCIHPELSGKQIYHYATDATIYVAATGRAVAHMTLRGDDPPVCTQPGLKPPDLPAEMPPGDGRLNTVLRDWLSVTRGYLSGGRLTDEALIDWLETTFES